MKVIVVELISQVLDTKAYVHLSRQVPTDSYRYVLVGLTSKTYMQL